MKFECVKCGKCCKQRGNLRFTKEDWNNLLSFLNLNYEEIQKIYKVENIEDRLYFIWVENICPFLLENNTCKIQQIKPTYCKMYIPYIDNGSSSFFNSCEGIGKGKDYSEIEIKKIQDILYHKLVIVKEK